MGTKFWVIRTTKVFLTILVILLGVELLKGHSYQNAAVFALAWAAITTVVFIGSRLYQSKKGVECALCDDIPKTDNTNNEK